MKFTVSWLEQGTIGGRILRWFLVLATVPAIVLTVVTNNLSAEALRDRVQGELMFIALSKAEDVETYAYERIRAAVVLRNDRYLVSSINALQKYRREPGRYARELQAFDGEIRPVLDFMIENLAFRNLIAFDPRGEVLYQSHPVQQLGNNLFEGLLKESPLAKAVLHATTLLDAEISDFGAYPGGDKPVGYVVTPLFDSGGELVAIIALQLDTDEVFAPFLDYSGLGNTGQTIVGLLDHNEIRIISPLRNQPDAAQKLRIQMGDSQGQGIQKAVLGNRDFGEIPGIFKEPVLASWTYLPSFRWGLSVQMDVGEALALVDTQRLVNGGLLALLLIPTALAASLVSRTISRPVGEAIAAAETVAAGDLTANLDSDRNDETGKLLRALGRMTSYLNSLVGQVQKSIIELVSTSNTLTAMNRAQEEDISAFGATTNQIAAASREISATSEELLRTMADVTRMAGSTAEMANAGRNELTDMEQVMHTLAESTGSIADKLNAISARASDISAMTTTIKRVAEQTNLLSLNASIEAEKAGEFGLGFSVVAREIRRLADQTAVATLDIETVVREMHAAVSIGVMEMDKFSEQVRRGVDETRRISQQFSRIIEQVGELTPRFDAVHEGMRSQSAGALQIRDAMVALSESAMQSARALEETNRASQRLETAIAELRKEIAIFRLS
ncbi:MULTISPECIES: methyl-accepting chemotaxis protein [Methylococcus]|nr:methyl-accepting chemotaxis protein [Methylococcus capsulatus]